MDRLIIAPDVHPAYLDGRLGRNAVRYVLALVTLALVSDPEELWCPPPGHVRLVAGLSRRQAASARDQLRKAGALTRTTSGKEATITLHTPGYLSWNEAGRGLAASGLRGLRAQRGARWPIMRAVLDMTPYGRPTATVRMAELARYAGYSPKWTRHTLDQLAEGHWLRWWEAEPGGLVTIALPLAPAALALIANPFDLPAGMQWASKP